MRVALARAAVCRPACVRDPAVRDERLLVERVLEARDLADRAASLDLRFAVQHGEACRVVAAVLEAPQTFHEHGNDVAFSDRAYDAAHDCYPPGVSGLSRLNDRPAGHGL